MHEELSAERRVPQLPRLSPPRKGPRPALTDGRSWSVQDVAYFLDVSASTVRRLERDGELPALPRIGKRIIFDPKVARAFRDRWRQAAAERGPGPLTPLPAGQMPRLADLAEGTCVSGGSNSPAPAQRQSPTADSSRPAVDRRSGSPDRRPVGNGGRRSTDQLTLPSKRASRGTVDRFTSAPLSDDTLLDVHEAAAYLRCSTSWIYKRVEDGALPVTRLNGWGVRFMLADLKKWVGEQGGLRPLRRKG